MQRPGVRFGQVFDSLSLASAVGTLHRAPILELHGNEHGPLSFQSQGCNHKPLNVAKVFKAILVVEVKDRNLQHSFIQVHLVFPVFLRFIVQNLRGDIPKDPRKVLQLKLHLDFPLEFINPEELMH
jgi:hypothetical protein